MTERSSKLLETADAQLAELIGLFSTSDETILRRPCPGREKLGDGTVATVAEHTANNYHRIAEFLHGRRGTGHDAPSRHGGDDRAETADLKGLLGQLSTGRATLTVLAELTDEQLDSVPAAGAIKFCDGRRTLEQILTSLLKHQAHQVRALSAAVADDVGRQSHGRLRRPTVNRSPPM